MDECVFCSILAGEGCASFVYRDDRVAAFLDIRPVNAGHVLVIPNRHAARLTDMEAADGMRLFQVAQRITAALYASGLPCEGVNLFLADGSAAGQDVPHAHLHIIPRFAQDSVAPCFLEHYDEPDASRADLDEIAVRIGAKLVAAREKSSNPNTQMV
jgi:histidine triad (HIT) family protein